MNCKIYGGICGVGGFCEDCPHKDHSEDVLDMVEEKPLDRGKVLAWIEANFIERPVTFDYDRSAFYPGVRFVKTPEFLEAINSGRLDVEEG